MYLKKLLLVNVRKSEDKYVAELTKEEFTKLILDFQIPMYRLAMGILKNEADAEDAVSNGIMNAFEHLYSLKNKEKFRTWIMTIIANEAKSIFRRRKKVDLYGDSNVFEGKEQSENKDIWQLVMTLDSEFSKVVILYYYEGFSMKEISKILHIPEGTVKSRLSRAKEKLKLIL